MQDSHAVEVGRWDLDLVLFRERLELDDSELTILLRIVHNMSVTHDALNLIRVNALDVIVIR